MRIGTRLPTPFHTAGGTGSVDPAVAPYRWPIALGGRGFLVDTAANQFRRGYDDTMRPQTDDGTRPGEQSLSTSKVWRRAYKSWHHGEGQSILDLEDNDPYRYFTGKGVDPWDESGLALLHDTEVARAKSSATFLTALVADGELVLIADTDVDTYDGATWTNLTTLGSAPSTATTDGSAVYLGCADTKIKKMTVSTGATTDDWTLANVDCLAFVKGRLIAGAGDSIYNLTPGVAAAAHWDHPFNAWRWDAITEGPTAIYIAGHLGDKSIIYKVGINDDGTLGEPESAAPLPDGELVTGLGTYLGYILVGTTKGVRFATPDTQGNLTMGAVIPTVTDVLAFEPQDRFVWFGWGNYDDTSTGLGRMDLSQFVGTLTPAYASDLMTDGDGNVTSIVTYGDKRWFTVQGNGLIGELDTVVALGTVDLSSTDFEIVEDKTALILELAHDPIDGAIEVWLEKDALGFESVGISSEQGSNSKIIQLDRLTASVFTIRVEMVPSTGDGPVLRSVLLRVRPKVGLTKQFVIPLIVSDTLEIDGVMVDERTAADDLAYLEGIIEGQEPTTLQMGTIGYTVIPDGGQFLPMKQTTNKTGWSGTYLIQLSEVTNNG